MDINQIDGYKILTNTMIHNTFLYKMGINELTDTFVYSSDCLSGGFYFCEYKDIYKWIDYKDDLKYICEVQLLSDSKIVKQNDKIKTDKFILKNKMLISEFLFNNRNDFDKELIFDIACKDGSMNILNFMIDKGLINPNRGFWRVCYYGYMELIYLLINKGANDWNTGLLNACSGGHINVVKYLIEKGANCLDNGLLYAFIYGHADIVNLLIEKGADNWNYRLKKCDL